MSMTQSQPQVAQMVDKKPRKKSKAFQAELQGLDLDLLLVFYYPITVWWHHTLSVIIERKI